MNSILSLSGGGTRGVYTLRILRRMEEHTQKKCSEMFSLIVGTSTGALIAAALVNEKSAEEIEEHYRKHICKIFRPKIKIIDRLLGKAYSDQPLRLAIRDLVGAEKANKSVSNINSNFIIISTDYKACSIAKFGNLNLAGVNREISLENALVSSTAAPTYFQPSIVGEDVYVDGGLVANSPDIVAVDLINRLPDFDIENSRMVSLGTACPKTAFAKVNKRKWGLGWLIDPTNRGIIHLTLAAQENWSLDFCKTLLGEGKYIRFDKKCQSPDEIKQLKDLDNCSDDAIDTAVRLADETWNEFKSREDFRQHFVCHL